ncbi:MAG: radical SAM/SPASM domain-containing protein [Methanotrichaceae archaeon]
MEYSLYSNPLLNVKARMLDGRIQVNLHGLLSLLPGVKSSIEMIDGQIPAYAGDRLYISTWLPPVPSKAFDRLADSQIKSLLSIRTPDQVTISITEECPNRCIHCALPDSGNKLRLEPDTVKDVISQILDMGTTLVIFDGGEPALYKELPELVNFVDDRAISTMFTSGAGFTPALAAQLKDAGLYAVNVSLDSPVPEDHDAMRGRKGVFKDAMSAVDACLKAGLLVDVYVVLRHENIRHLQSFHDLARRIGAHELTFFEIVPTGRWAGKKGVALSAEDRQDRQRFVSSAGSPRIFSVYDALLRFGCFAGRSWMHITPSGDIYPCACMPRPFGNIFAAPIAEIWKRMSDLPYKGQKTCPMRE